MNIETKERPILFSTPMVRSIMSGMKTQTRRVMRYQPPSDEFQLSRLMDTTDSSKRKSVGKLHWVKIDGLNILDDTDKFFSCPYGSAGGRLWVKETFARIDDESGYGSGYFEYKASCVNSESFIWTPSIHMPRFASRILLKVTSVLVERLNDISDEDAIAEGCISTVICNESGDDYSGRHPKEAYADLWESINGPGSWDLNPFVWKIEFEIERMKR